MKQRNVNIYMSNKSFYYQDLWKLKKVKKNKNTFKKNYSNGFLLSN